MTRFGEGLGVGQRAIGPGRAFRPEFVGVSLGFLGQDVFALDDIGDLAEDAILVGLVRETLMGLGRKEDRKADDDGGEHEAEVKKALGHRSTPPCEH